MADAVVSVICAVALIVATTLFNHLQFRRERWWERKAALYDETLGWISDHREKISMFAGIIPKVALVMKRVNEIRKEDTSALTQDRKNALASEFKSLSTRLDEIGSEVNDLCKAWGAQAKEERRLLDRCSFLLSKRAISALTFLFKWEPVRWSTALEKDLALARSDFENRCDQFLAEARIDLGTAGPLEKGAYWWKRFLGK